MQGFGCTFLSFFPLFLSLSFFFNSNVGTLTKPHRSLPRKMVQVFESRKEREKERKERQEQRDTFWISNLMRALFNEIGRRRENWKAFRSYQRLNGHSSFLPRENLETKLVGFLTDQLSYKGETKLTVIFVFTKEVDVGVRMMIMAG